MPLSDRIELMTRPETERFETLIHRLREIADATPPPPQTAQRLGRLLIDLPPEAVPVLADNIWLTPGRVSTITASPFISDKAFAAGWLAFTGDLTVGRVAMAIDGGVGHGQQRRVLLADRRSDPVGHHPERCARGEAGLFVVALVPAPSAGRPPVEGCRGRTRNAVALGLPRVLHRGVRE